MRILIKDDDFPTRKYCLHANRNQKFDSDLFFRFRDIFRAAFSELTNNSMKSQLVCMHLSPSDSFKLVEFIILYEEDEKFLTADEIQSLMDQLRNSRQ